jgi:hypothetical protein
VLTEALSRWDARIGARSAGGHDVVENEPELVEAEILGVLAAKQGTSPSS